MLEGPVPVTGSSSTRPEVVYVPVMVMTGQKKVSLVCLVVTFMLEDKRSDDQPGEVLEAGAAAGGLQAPGE